VLLQPSPNFISFFPSIALALVSVSSWCLAFPLILSVLCLFRARDEFFVLEVFVDLSFVFPPQPRTLCFSMLNIASFMDRGLFPSPSCVLSSPTMTFSPTLEAAPYDCFYRIIHEMLRVLKRSTERIFCFVWKARAAADSDKRLLWFII